MGLFPGAGPRVEPRREQRAVRGLELVGEAGHVAFQLGIDGALGVRLAAAGIVDLRLDPGDAAPAAQLGPERVLAAALVELAVPAVAARATLLHELLAGQPFTLFAPRLRREKIGDGVA